MIICFVVKSTVAEIASMASTRQSDIDMSVQSVVTDPGGVQTPSPVGEASDCEVASDREVASDHEVASDQPPQKFDCSYCVERCRDDFDAPADMCCGHPQVDCCMKPSNDAVESDCATDMIVHRTSMTRSTDAYHSVPLPASPTDGTLHQNILENSNSRTSLPVQSS